MSNFANNPDASGIERALDVFTPRTSPPVRLKMDANCVFPQHSFTHLNDKNLEKELGKILDKEPDIVSALILASCWATGTIFQLISSVPEEEAHMVLAL